MKEDDDRENDTAPWKEWIMNNEDTKNKER